MKSKFLVKTLLLIISLFVFIYLTTYSVLNGSYSPDIKTCSQCINTTFDYVIMNAQACKTRFENEQIETVFVIFSRIENINARIALRRTWLKYAIDKSEQIRYTFVFGLSLKEEENKMLLDESALHGDITQGVFLDCYKGLTNKTLFALQWITQLCANARYFVKTDDDVFLNLFNLQRVLQINSDTLKSNVIGACAVNRNPVRQKQSKYYISYSEYPFFMYPKFCSGTCYAASVELAHKIRQISVNVPYFPLEDVYVGMCLQLIGATVKHVSGFNTNADSFLQKDFFTAEFISGHSLSPATIEIVWKFQFLN